MDHAEKLISEVLFQNLLIFIYFVFPTHPCVISLFATVFHFSPKFFRQNFLSFDAAWSVLTRVLNEETATDFLFSPSRLNILTLVQYLF